jgi:hypothetical protein
MEKIWVSLNRWVKWKDRINGAKGTKSQSKQRSLDQDKGRSTVVDPCGASVINGCRKEPQYPGVPESPKSHQPYDLIGR